MILRLKVFRNYLGRDFSGPSTSVARTLLFSALLKAFVTATQLRVQIWMLCFRN
jgi:hypothetical protein